MLKWSLFYDFIISKIKYLKSIQICSFNEPCGTFKKLLYSIVPLSLTSAESVVSVHLAKNQNILSFVYLDQSVVSVPRPCL